MLSQPENNIKLDDAQTLAIEEVKLRLANLESEISIAQKNQKNLKIENEKLVKDNIYQNELLSATEAKLIPLQAQITDLDDKISTKKDELTQITAEIEVKSKELEPRESAVIEKEKELNLKAESIKNDSIALDIAKTEIENKVSDFNTKVAKLKEVLPTL